MDGNLAYPSLQWICYVARVLGFTTENYTVRVRSNGHLIYSPNKWLKAIGHRGLIGWWTSDTGLFAVKIRRSIIICFGELGGRYFVYERLIENKRYHDLSFFIHIRGICGHYSLNSLNRTHLRVPLPHNDYRQCHYFKVHDKSGASGLH